MSMKKAELDCLADEIKKDIPSLSKNMVPNFDNKLSWQVLSNIGYAVGVEIPRNMDLNIDIGKRQMVFTIKPDINHTYSSTVSYKNGEIYVGGTIKYRF